MLWETSCLKVAWDCEISMNCQADLKRENKRLMSVLGANSRRWYNRPRSLDHESRLVILQHECFSGEISGRIFLFWFLFSLICPAWCRRTFQRIHSWMMWFLAYSFRVPHVICKNIARRRRKYKLRKIFCLILVLFSYFEPIIHCRLACCCFCLRLLTV